MKQNIPHLYALRAFTVAAQSSSFSQAAELLNVTPGAVSRHIRTLEDHFACQLFERNGPKVMLTDAGRMLAVQLQQGFSQLENACRQLRSTHVQLRLKAPSTLTMRWLLDVMADFRAQHETPEVEVSSIWMDIDNVDFTKEPFDCAILLGNGHFGAGTRCLRLFDEWLLPLCAPDLLDKARDNLAACELIHPSRDRRDWRRWLNSSGLFSGVSLAGGKVFDTLEQGMLAAMGGHGVTIGDLLLSQSAMDQHLLVAPFPLAIGTGDGYYLVWPGDSARQNNIDKLALFLQKNIPRYVHNDITIQN
ncbi:DNA-binding transcriptional LysR family regulator [Grimontella sp. AG753]|nr:DNA-binding transcriptional LysR family regulator [Grimontella sp. AG753]TCW43509.1 DNA-binding transcriptional LysR family regulator [Phytobacter diazotrophicus]